jgi:hypothetical protein
LIRIADEKVTERGEKSSKLSGLKKTLEYLKCEFLFIYVLPIFHKVRVLKE